MGLIQPLAKGYEITEKSLQSTPINNEIYQAIAEFCISKGVTPPIWNPTAMRVILTKYNSLACDPDNPMDIRFQLAKRCRKLPQKVTLVYFIKVLGLEEIYKQVVADPTKETHTSPIEYTF